MELREIEISTRITFGTEQCPAVNVLDRRIEDGSLIEFPYHQIGKIDTQ